MKKETEKKGKKFFFTKACVVLILFLYMCMVASCGKKGELQPPKQSYTQPFSS